MRFSQTVPAVARDGVDPKARTFAISEKGLAFGETVLVPLRQIEDAPEIAIDGAEERILALLAIAYGKTIGPFVLSNIRRAARYWNGGQAGLAAIELALTGLPPLLDQRAVYRLGLADGLLAEGVSPRELVNACGLDTTPLDLTRAGYNADQPRVPAGDPDGGQWSSGERANEDVTSGSTISPLGEPPGRAENTEPYRVIKEPPKNARVVVPPDGVPIRAGNPPTTLIAPRHADYHQVYAAGRAISSLPPLDQALHIRAALHQGGTYDFQRDPIRRETQPAYANASNYAVGVYLAGAGYSLWAARKMAEAYAFFNSSNYGSQNQADWLEQGWRDGTTGRWK